MEQVSLNSWEVTGVESINIPILWHQISPLIERALKYSDGEYILQDIYSLLMYQKMQLWVVSDGVEVKACLVTEFRLFPQKKVCYIVFAAGEEITRWEHCFDEIEQWAYDEGADLIRALGRPGWKILSEQHGYYRNQYLYCKELHIPEGTAH